MGGYKCEGCGELFLESDCEKETPLELAQRHVLKDHFSFKKISTYRRN